MKRISSRLRVETGASLVLVLVISIVVSLTLAAILYASTGNILYAQKLGTPETANTDVDSALQAATNNLRNSTFNNGTWDGTALTGETCAPSQDGAFTPNLKFVGPNTGNTVLVNCVTNPSTTGATGWNLNTYPANQLVNGTSLMTLGTLAQENGATSPGGVVQAAATGTLAINGKVASKAAVNAVAGGTLAVTNGGLVSNSACNTVPTTITSTPSPNCNSGTAINDPGPGPGYNPPTVADYSTVYRDICDATVPLDVTGVTCTAGVPTACTANVSFSPGYYDDAKELSTLMNGGIPSCQSRTFWFKGGASGLANYYFDFHNGESPVPDATYGTSPIWTVNHASVRVVAGGDPVGSGPGYPVTIPGSCTSPSTGSANNGVNFVFGGRSQLVISAGQLEICGQYAAGAPPTAIYGAKTGPDTVTSAWGMFSTTWTSPTGASAGCSSTPANTFGNPGRAAYLDGSISSSQSLNQAGRNACLKNTNALGPNSPTIIPVGSILSNATLVVTHRENTPTAILKARVTPSAITGGAAPCNSAAPTVNTWLDVPPTPTNALVTNTVDFTDQLFKRVHDCGYAGSVTDYDALYNGANLTARVDTIQLLMTFKPPGVRAQDQSLGTFTSTGSYIPQPSPATAKSNNQVWPAGQTNVTITSPQATGTAVPAANCVGATPYPNGTASCAMIKSTGGAVMAVQGLVYAPLAALDLGHLLVTTPVATAAFVRKLLSTVTRGPSYTGPIFGAAVPASSVTVDLNAYTGPSGSLCLTQTSGVPPPPCALSGTTTVTYKSGVPIPVSGSRDVTVQNWTISP